MRAPIRLIIVAVLVAGCQTVTPEQQRAADEQQRGPDPRRSRLTGKGYAQGLRNLSHGDSEPRRHGLDGFLGGFLGPARDRAERISELRQGGSRCRPQVRLCRSFLVPLEVRVVTVRALGHLCQSLAAFPERIDSQLTFLLALNLFLLVLGTMLDIFSALVLVVPLVLPLAVGYGIDPLHLGIIFLANMQIGYITPPVGLNLFIASYRFQQPIAAVVRASLPFMLLLLVAVLIITYWPALSLALVR